MIAFGSLVGIVNGLSVGFGATGSPHILVRYMSIDDPRKLTRAALIGTFWAVVMGWGAVFIGLAARMSFPDVNVFPGGDHEYAFLFLAREHFHPLLFGFAIAALLAALMSTVDSQLLIISSGLARDVYQKILHKNREIDERKMVFISRIATFSVILIAFFLGVLVSIHYKEWPIFKYVLLAWSGLGAAFGPALILSLYWKRTTKWGVLAGFIGGLAATLLWKGVFNIHMGFSLAEYLPGFLFATLCVIVVSLVSCDGETKAT
jgi:SSS family solute:Na+ symporter/sodium/proline symporter